MDAATQAEEAMAAAAIARNSVEVKERWVVRRRPGRQVASFSSTLKFPCREGSNRALGEYFWAGVSMRIDGHGICSEDGSSAALLEIHNAEPNPRRVRARSSSTKGIAIFLRNCSRNPTQNRGAVVKSGRKKNRSSGPLKARNMCLHSI